MPAFFRAAVKFLDVLKKHENEVSVGCAKEVKALKAKMGKS